MPLEAEQILQNRYRITAPLKSGGMGSIYRAWDVRLGISVALKEMTAQPDLDPETLAKLRHQFQQEATLLAPLDHPNLVDVTDFFEEDGNAYLVMRLIQGENLAERIERQGALSEEQVLAWAEQLLNALTYCHTHGVLHRDVKPQNVIIRPDGQAILVDFGLVKFWDPNAPATHTVVRGAGTPEYAPPEQYDIRGSGHTDPRTDIYSLGATLYHTLGGQPPPTATQRIVNPAALKPVQALNPESSHQTEIALRKALELRPDNRFQSAAEMLAALRGEADIEPSPRPARRAVSELLPPTEQATVEQPPPAKPAQTGRRTWIIILAVAAVVITILGANWLFGRRTLPATDQIPATSTVENTPENTPEDTPEIIPTATDTPHPPTGTPLPPADTPSPTPTSQPTETPTPAADAVVLDDGAGLRPGATMWWGVRETLPAGTELELTGFDPNFEDWVYVRTVDGSSVGWTRITDLEINRRLADLPLVTPRPTLAPTSTPTTVPTPLGCETGPLTLDAWGTGTTCHSGGSWSASIFAQGHGGNCMYTYTWEGVVKAGPIPGSMSFEIPGAGAIVGTVFVSSGDETVSGKVYVPAPECD